MITVLPRRNSIARRIVTLAAMLMTVLLVSACSTGGVSVGSLFSDDKPEAGNTGQQAQGTSPFGAAPGGPVKVAILLPLSAPGQTASIGKALKNAAEAALLDSGSQNIQLITKDTQGNADGARSAANAALNEGATLILGPLLSAEVQAISPIARQRNVSVIAFSSVAGVAGNGVYLMSFLPSEEVSNLVRYAATQGIRNIAAMVPQSAYGGSAENALNQAAAANGAKIVALDRYPRSATGVASTSKAVAGKIANSTNNIQGLFLPEGGSMLANAANGLGAAGVTSGKVRMLGTGLWDERSTSNVKLVSGGWYAGVSPDLIARFSGRYQKAYGNTPPRLASLAYDAVSLAVIVTRNAPGGRASAQDITNPEGFKGVNGLFRFRRNGLVERGLSILEVTPTGPREVSPAPDRFSAAF
ncbi:penicillin-binding protein activator [Anderseniella sp. Alg231-50]|uniref:penicillin-binding protein activator n=1 Tax=Anderseniella sp. Alg231-50 TaxID=1922226 RepID=UPI000D557087